MSGKKNKRSQLAANCLSFYPHQKEDSVVTTLHHRSYVLVLVTGASVVQVSELD